jgi:D-proline reductase (dithiol) PrdB
VSLAARHLEEYGIPTVVFGCARDIVEHCGVPRFVFSDFPLGNPTGKPFDLDMQREVLSLGLDLLVEATAPGPTVVTPYEWSADHSWKDKIFTKDQPFLDAEATRKWQEAKAKYRALKATGKS